MFFRLFGLLTSDFRPQAPNLNYKITKSILCGLFSNVSLSDNPQLLHTAPHGQIGLVDVIVQANGESDKAL